MSTATELRKALAAADVDPAQIEDIVSKSAQAGVTEDDTVTADQIDEVMAVVQKAYSDVETETETDEIVKSDTEEEEDYVLKAYGDDEAMKADDDDEDDEDDEDEDEDEEMGKAWALVDVIAKSADDIVHEVRSEHDELVKAYKNSTNALKMLSKAVSQQASTLASFQAQFDNINKALGQPVAPRAALSNVDVVEHPAETPSYVDGQSIMAKAMTAIRSEETTPIRKRELFDAVSSIEAGMDPAAVAQQYGISE